MVISSAHVRWLRSGRKASMWWLLLLGLLPLLLWPFFGDHELSDTPRAFSAGAWKAAKGNDRCDMVEDLVKRVGLTGRSRDEVRLLLGEPESHGNGPDHYDLCPSPMDVYILEVRWKNGVVTSALIRDT